MAATPSPEPQMLIVGGKRRGRPLGSRSASEPGSTLSIYLPASEHEFYAKLAAKRGESLSTCVRSLLLTKWQRGQK